MFKFWVLVFVLSYICSGRKCMIEPCLLHHDYKYMACIIIIVKCFCLCRTVLEKLQCTRQHEEEMYNA